jgi:hypothetical protein
MNADNNLEPFMQLNVEQMLNASKDSRQLNIVVRVDRIGKYWNGSLPGLPAFTDAKDILIADGKITVLEDLGEINMDVNSNLEDFIKTYLPKYTYDFCALVLWDHGGAFYGYGGDETEKRMFLYEIHIAIYNGLTAAGKTKFDLFGFDACLMADIEQIYYSSLISDYYIASMELEPGHGWDWSAFECILNTPKIQPYALGQEIINKFIAFAAYYDSGRASLILLDLAYFPDVQDAIVALAGALTLSQSDSYYEDLLRLLRRARLISWMPGATPTEDDFDLVDLGQCLTNMKTMKTPDFTTFPVALQTAVTNCINALELMTYYYNYDVTMDGTTGISIYWAYDSPVDTYWVDSLTGTPLIAWHDFLNSFLDATASGGSTPVQTLEILSIDMTIDDFTVNAYATPSSDIAKADVSWGYTVNGVDFFLSYTDAIINYNTENIQGKFDNIITASCIDSDDYNTCFPVYCAWRIGATYITGTNTYNYFQKGSLTSKLVYYVLYYDFVTDELEEEYYIETDQSTTAFQPVVGDIYFPIIYDTNYNWYQSPLPFKVLEDGYIPFVDFISFQDFMCTVLFAIEVQSLSSNTSTVFKEYNYPTENCTQATFIHPIEITETWSPEKYIPDPTQPPPNPPQSPHTNPPQSPQTSPSQSPSSPSKKGSSNTLSFSTLFISFWLIFVSLFTQK